jgi:hypothetical protein
MNPYTDDNPSVPDHPAERAFQRAAELGAGVAQLLRIGPSYWDIPIREDDGTQIDWAESAARQVVEAASYYHEGLILSDECPECGAHVSRFTRCGECHEPEAVTF